MSAPTKIGKYEVVETIGKGGFATVYKARDPLLKRFVAVKLCAPEGEGLRRRFLREAEIAGTLDHPSIVRTFDCGFTDDGAYLVQEYLDGEDLRRKIRSKAPLSYSTRVGYQIELAEGLAYAHSKGVLHRDIKPGNVRVLSSGRIKILDFGIGKLSSAHTVLTQQGTVLGTAGYLPPEQALGREVDQRADVFAFGALSYELLTYHQPFPGDRLAERIKKVLESTPEPIYRFWPECPVELEGLVFRCLEKAPAARYAGFAEVIAELRTIHQKLVAIEQNATLVGAPAVADTQKPTEVAPPLEPPELAAPQTPAEVVARQKPPGVAVPPKPPEVVATQKVDLTNTTDPFERPAPREPAAPISPFATEAPTMAPRGVAAPPIAPAAVEPRSTAGPDLRARPVPPPVSETVPMPPVIRGAPLSPPAVESPRTAPPVVPPPVPPAPFTPSQSPPLGKEPAPAAAPPAPSPPLEKGGRPAGPGRVGGALAALGNSLRTHRVAWLAAMAVVIVVLAGAALWNGLGSDAPVPVPTPVPIPTRTPPPQATAGPTGGLVIAAFPWGDLVGLEDAQGQPVEIPADSATPLKLDLPAGQYRVQVRRSGATGEPSVCTVTVEPATLQICRVELGRVSALEYFGASGWWP